MRLRLSFLLSALLLTGAATAQDCGRRDLYAELPEGERAAIEAAIADVPFASGTFWEARKGDQRLVIAGTLHIPDPRMDAIVRRLAPEVRRADALILEIDNRAASEMETLASERPELFFLTEGPSLIDLLGDDWPLAEERLAAAGVPGFLGAKMRPWYAALTVGMPECAMRALTEGRLGLDRRLETVAVRNDVPVRSLEDTESVIELLASGDDAEDAEMLVMSLRTGLDQPAMVSTLVEGYFAGRTAAVLEFNRRVAEDAFPGEGARLFDEFIEALLIQRNAAWEAQLAEVIGDGDAVLAIGAAHLPGESGVLAALERLGWTVSPLPG